LSAHLGFGDDPDSRQVWQSALAIAIPALESEAVRIATRLGRDLERRGQMICTAESCTGGAIARALTEVAGSSAWFDSAYITYSNRAKMVQLQVPSEMLETEGAVSEPVAAAMASSAGAQSRCALALAVSGIAGPSGGSLSKPVGTVCFAWAMSPPAHQDGGLSISSTQVRALTRLLPGDRHEVRLRTVCFSLLIAEMLLAKS
jgi:nicotinamide-nucleotide amidase